MRTSFRSRDRIWGNSPMLHFLNRICKPKIFWATVIRSLVWEEVQALGVTVRASVRCSHRATRKTLTDVPEGLPSTPLDLPHTTTYGQVRGCLRTALRQLRASLDGAAATPRQGHPRPKKCASVGFAGRC